MLANASRLIRATVLLEALLRDGAPLPQRDSLDARSRAEADRVLATIVAALREDRALDAPLLRPDERRLAPRWRALDDSDDPVAIAVADACDRIADSVDTLAHLLRPPTANATCAPEANARQDDGGFLGGLPAPLQDVLAQLGVGHPDLARELRGGR